MRLPLHDERLVDKKVHEKKIGDKQHLRNPHLQDLKDLEQKIRDYCPLDYCTYDVVRFSRPYFKEFSYTEMFGGILVSPASSEIAVQLSEFGLNQSVPVNDFEHLEKFLQDRLDSQGSLDKYSLKKSPSFNSVDRIVFLPGSNLFPEMVSKEILARLLWENPDVLAKFHPFTNEGTIRAICADFGYDRFIDGNESGWHYLKNAKEVWSTSASEMGLYAVLFGIPLKNVGNFFTEHKGAFYPVFKFVADKPIEVAQRTLKHLLASPYSGFFIPSDPNVDEKIQKYFKKAMELREFHKPSIFEAYNLQMVPVHPEQSGRPIPSK
ncbi:hypothetical protein [Caulobacter phage Cr30]|uniref:hypothetical protein n=1 Tax=Caulobacter phage Cr30 TaxID=1357714 RepID=UPI0004A9B5E6|nr:hypothetical protein OZ74_gp255 [Caulobacter phage Cr30]AGS81088.1 hypothetical protein [Caulobacter phage Cr30]